MQKTTKIKASAPSRGVRRFLSLRLKSDLRPHPSSIVGAGGVQRLQHLGEREGGVQINCQANFQDTFTVAIHTSAVSGSSPGSRAHPVITRRVKLDNPLIPGGRVVIPALPSRKQNLRFLQLANSSGIVAT